MQRSSLFTLKKPFSLNQPESFSLFYEQAHTSVFRYIMVLCGGNQKEAEDITAEAFFRAWEKRQQFSGDASAALGWVITIARHRLIDQRRSENVDTVEAMDEALSDQHNDIESMLVDEEQLQQILEAIQNLPFPHRDIITLRYVLGWRVNAIATHLNLAENTASVYLRRALAKLQAQLALHETQTQRTVYDEP